MGMHPMMHGAQDMSKYMGVEDQHSYYNQNDSVHNDDSSVASQHKISNIEGKASQGIQELEVDENEST